MSRRNLPERDLLVINSDEEMKQHVEVEYPPIDFAQKTLVFAHGGSNIVGVANKFQEVSDSNYEMTVFSPVYGDGCYPLACRDNSRQIAIRQ